MKYKSFFIAPFFLLAIMLSSLSYAETVWIDVRSAAEYAQDNIEGDTRISHEEIVQGVSGLLLDKNADIILYCRSGRRAAIAMSALVEAGYTNISNAGGIDDARKARNLNQ